MRSQVPKDAPGGLIPIPNRALTRRTRAGPGDGRRVSLRLDVRSGFGYRDGSSTLAPDRGTPGGRAARWIGLAWILLAPLGASDPASTGGRVEVTADRLELLVEPDARAYAIGQARRGDRLTTAGQAAPDGWLAVEPPGGSFVWIEDRGIDPIRGRVGPRGVRVRFAREGAGLPGPPGVELAPGTPFRLFDHPALVMSGADGTGTWRPIEPPLGLTLFVRAGGVGPIAVTARRDPQAMRTAGPGEVDADLAQIEAAVRDATRGPVHEWHLEAVRRQSRTILDRAGSSPALAAKAEQVDRLHDMAEAARRFQAVVDRGRARDGEVSANRVSAARVEDEPGPYVGRGLVQASSRTTEGQKLYALIGRDGRTQAYLDVPPGLEIAGRVGTRVGVRGQATYNAALRARLIKVRDLDPIDPPDTPLP